MIIRLYTKLADRGYVMIVGQMIGNEVVFFHPADDGTHILRVTRARCFEIAHWHEAKQRKANMLITIEDSKRNALEESCVHCRAMILRYGSDDGDFVHSLPYCEAYKETGKVR